MLQMLILLIILLSFIQARLDYNSSACDIYLQKFGTSNNVNGTGATQLAFSGDIEIIEGTANLKVNLRYSDNQYFNNDTFYGLVQEDGKAANETCLDLRLYKYSSKQYENETQVTDLEITHSSSFQKKWRYYSFIINGNDFITRLIQTENSEQYLYTGFYSIKFLAAKTEELQYSFFFQFTVIINKNLTSSPITILKPYSNVESQACISGDGCIINSATSISWCSDISCSKIIGMPDLYSGFSYYVKQTILKEEMQSFYLSNATIYFNGDGLYKQATIINQNYQNQGYAIYQFSLDVAWSNLTIQITAYLTTEIQSRRFLQDSDTQTETVFDPVNGESDSIVCIKYNTTYVDTCASCSQQCLANSGIASSECEACPLYQALLGIIAILYLCFGL